MELTFFPDEWSYIGHNHYFHFTFFFSVLHHSIASFCDEMIVNSL